MFMLIRLLSFDIYQWLALIFCLTMLAKSWSHFLRKEKSLRELIAWHIVFVGMGLIAISPSTVEKVAQITGFKSGINAIIFLSLAVLFYLVFRLVNVIENMEKKFTKLVRKLALKESDDKHL